MIHRFETIDSTNTRAKEMAQQGAPHGTVLIARQQTGGRGRLGRSFHSPPGAGIYMSMILRPKCSPDNLMHLTCATAVAMCDAVEATTGFRPGIKWTNDLVWGKRKLGGILTELGFDGSELAYAVVGIGINCTQSADDFPPELQEMAASLSMATGAPIDTSRLEEEMIRALNTMDAELLTQIGVGNNQDMNILISFMNDIIMAARREERPATPLESFLDWLRYKQIHEE